MSGITKAVLRRLESEIGELLERHDEGSRDLGEFAQYEDDPVGFIRSILGGAPWSKQVEISEAVRDRPLVLVQACNASGKDWLAARLALWWVYSRRGFAIVTAATQRQVREVMFREIRSAWHGANLPGELFEQLLRVDRDANIGIIGLTSSDSSKLQGFHASRILGILSEAQGIEAYGWEAMHACAVGEHDRLLALGNPVAPSGQFFEAARSANWHTLRASAFEHPNLTAGRTIIPGGPSQAFVDRIAAEFGRSSGIYAARVLGEFPTESEYGLVKRAWLEESAERHAKWSIGAGTIKQRQPPGEPFVGVDVARYGPDFSVAATMIGGVLQGLETWGQVDLMETVGRVVQELTQAGVRPRLSAYEIREREEHLALQDALSGLPYSTRRQAYGWAVVDVVGSGGGVADRLKELGYRVVEFNGGRRPTAAYQSKCMNLRAESYWIVRELLEAGELDLPHDEELWRELVSTTWRANSAGHIQIGAKDELRGELGRSPDKADAVSMAACIWHHKEGASAAEGFWPVVR